MTRYLANPSRPFFPFCLSDVSSVHPSVPRPSSRRELLERFDELLTELAARAYEEESLTTPMDDLD